MTIPARDVMTRTVVTAETSYPAERALAIPSQSMQ